MRWVVVVSGYCGSQPSRWVATAAGHVPDPPPLPATRSAKLPCPRSYVDLVKVRPREAADQAAAEAFLARHNSLRGARLGELAR